MKASATHQREPNLIERLGSSIKGALHLFIFGGVAVYQLLEVGKNENLTEAQKAVKLAFAASVLPMGLAGFLMHNNNPNSHSSHMRMFKFSGMGALAMAVIDTLLTSKNSQLPYSTQSERQLDVSTLRLDEGQTQAKETKIEDQILTIEPPIDTPTYIPTNQYHR